MEIGNLLFGNSRGIFPLDREELQETFWEFLVKSRLDSYGRPEKDSPFISYYIQDEDYIETDKFILRPYYWGEDEVIAMLPNFVYKPENIEISWYKYPLRDSYANVKISKEKLKEILEACLI